MTTENFMDYAKCFGYEIRFTGIGMSYIEIGGVKLTETADFAVTTRQLAQIGMAIMMDTLRTKEW